MTETIEFLGRHGYLLLFTWVLVERVGMPLPALPVLLAAGALARMGHLSFAVCVTLAVGACVISDTVWYDIGRRRGGQILRWLCRISLEPDSCVRRTQDTLARQGARSLLVSKFLPALNVAAAPLAGMLGMKMTRFLLFDAVGALIWVLAFMIPGYLLSSQLEQAASRASVLGISIVAILLGVVAAYITWKYVQRRRFLRSVRIARITPEDLSTKLSAGEDVVVVDLRHSMEFEADPRTIPGALHIPVERFEQRHLEIPRDRDVVLYCT